MKPVDLISHKGETLLFRFRDGQVVKGTLFHVDLDPPGEFMYDLLEIIQCGVSELPNLSVGTSVTARLAELDEFELLV